MFNDRISINGGLFWFKMGVLRGLVFLGMRFWVVLLGKLWRRDLVVEGEGIWKVEWRSEKMS